MTLLWMSLTGGLLILLVWALRKPVLAKLPAGVMPVLWGVVLLRLLLPLALPVEMALPNMEPKAEPKAEPLAQLQAQPEGPEAVGVWEETPESAGEPLAWAGGALLETEGGIPMEKLAKLALGIWLLGALGLGSSFLLSYRRAKREFARSWEAGEGPAREALEALLARKPLRRKVALRYWAQGDSPITYGLLRPVILLPVGCCGRNPGELALMLAHELAHIRRMDALYKLLTAGALCVHWFNPLVWLFVRLVGKDLELSCDEAVAGRLDGRGRGYYARILLRMAAEKSGVAFGLGGMGRNTMEERIEMLMKRKQITMAAALACVLAVAGVTTVFALSAARPKLKLAAPAAQVATTSEDVGILPEEPTEKELTALYGPYGVTFEKGKMLLEGEPVRYFFDGVEVTEGSRISHYEYYSDLGTVDACTVRGTIDNGDGSVNPFGPLKGIRRCTKEEFDQHTLDLLNLMEDKGQVAVTEDSGEAISYSGDASVFAGLTGDHHYYYSHCPNVAVYLGQEATAASDVGSAAAGKTVAQKILEYGAYGVSYRDGDIYYNGKRVGSFVDVKPGGGVFSCQSRRGGEGTLCACYDYNDRLWGVELYPQGAQVSLNTPIRAAEETEALAESAALWEKTLAPYLEYGLTYEYDPVADYRSGCGLKMWYNGQEVRCIWDETTGTCISEHQNGSALHGSYDLCTVYQNGHLCGLRHYTGTAAGSGSAGTAAGQGSTVYTHHPEPQGHHGSGHHH